MKIYIALAAATLMLAGCAKKNDTPEAVKQGVLRDISKSFNVANMEVSVDAVSFRDKEADATVSFMLKGGSREQATVMQYVMERHSDNQWYIKSRASSHMNAAADAGAAGASGAAALPAGHPAMGTGTAAPAAGDPSKMNLPPGHPELGQAK